MVGQQVATVQEAPIQPGTRVLLRVDYNLPVDAHNQITDDTRLAASLPTVRYCLERGAKVILCSHFGRPDGQWDPQFSLRPVFERLQKKLPDVPVQFATDCVGAAVEQQVAQLPQGGVLLLENTRFHAAETANDPVFSRALANLGDIFVNDAFGALHRSHASTVGVTAYLPGYAGFLVAQEIAGLSHVIEKPARPLTVVIGGKKVADKLPLVLKLADIADNLLVGGKIASEWPTLGKTHAQIDVATDATFDITPDTVQRWAPIIARSQTIFWNGPLGQVEVPQYALGTRAVAQLIADSGAYTVVGGGDTVAALHPYQFNHVSTGGGAALAFIQGENLPGLTCLKQKEDHKK